MPLSDHCRHWRHVARYWLRSITGRGEIATAKRTIEMKSSFLGWLLAASCALPLAATSAPAAEPGLRLERVVMLMRHGVRSPTNVQPIPHAARRKRYRSGGCRGSQVLRRRRSFASNRLSGSRRNHRSSKQGAASDPNRARMVQGPSAQLRRVSFTPGQRRSGPAVSRTRRRSGIIRRPASL